MSFMFWEKNNLSFENSTGETPLRFSLLYDDTTSIIHVFDLAASGSPALRVAANYQFVKHVLSSCVPLFGRPARLFFYGRDQDILEWRAGSFCALKESDYRLIYDPYVQKMDRGGELLRKVANRSEWGSMGF
jgi:hypothetical protein